MQSELFLLSGSRFDALNSFIRRRRRWIILAWVVALGISLVFIPSFFSSVSYNITGGSGPTNSESVKAANILSTEFPGSNNGSTIKYSGSVIRGVTYFPTRSKIAFWPSTPLLPGDKNIGNYTGMDSVYSTEYGILNSSLPSLLPQVESLESNIASLNKGMYSVQSNLSSLSTNLFQLQNGINQSAQLIYGIPSSFVQIWMGAQAQGITNPFEANSIANSTIYKVTTGTLGGVRNLSGIPAFFKAWNSTFQTLPNSTSPLVRESNAIQSAVAGALEQSWN